MLYATCSVFVKFTAIVTLGLPVEHNAL